VSGEPGPDEYPVVTSRRVFDGRVIALRVDQVRMSDGAVAAREVVEHPGAVGVVALDERDRVILVRQYRHPVRGFLDELPAGLLDVPGESALAGAKRELAEEARLAADDWHALIDLHTSPGMTDEAIRVFLARGLRPAAEDGFAAEGEELTLTVSAEPLDEAVRRALAGEITNAAAVAGLCAAAVARAGGWAALRPADAPWPGWSG